jgi:hypothetical protein
MKRAVRIVLSVIFIVITLFWLLSHLFLGNLIRDEARLFGEKIGYEISVGDIALSPLTLSAQLKNLRITSVSSNGASGETLFKLKQLDVDARFIPLLLGRISIEQILFDGPEILLSRSAQTTNANSPLWNWQRFLNRVSQIGDPAEKEVNAASTKFTIDALSVTHARIAVRDGQQKLSYDLGPMSLQLNDLTNHDVTANSSETSISSKYVINLGQVKVPLPKIDGVPDRVLAFDQVKASGHLIENSESVLKLALNLSLDSGEIKSTIEMVGSGKNQGALTGKISLNGLAVKPLLNLLPSYQPLDSSTGVISGEVILKQDQEALTVDADIKVDELDVRVRGSNESLLTWATTSLDNLRLVLPQSENRAGSLTIDNVLVDRPKIRFVMDAQRQSNFRSLFTKPDTKTLNLDPGDASVPRVSAVLKPLTNPPEFRYDVRSIRLKDGAMHFSDESIKPVFRVDVTDLNGSIQGVSNEPNRYASLVLNGRAAKTGSLRARGQLAFADPRQNNDVSLIFRNIPLNATNPYTMTFAGYAIDDGRIDVDLRYVTKNGALEGKNRFIIKKIKLGEPVADYEGTRLPLGLAIALLEDSDGMIDVNIPVKGNVNDPEFSVGHLVWQAVKTMLSNVVSAPFRALGALLGIENVDAIAFVPGESALPPDGEEQLMKIAEFLAKRPKSTLVIHGTYDPKVDADELARAMADQAILEASGIKVAAGEPLPLPNLTDPKVQAGLKSAYGAQVGRIKLGQRLLTLPDNADRDTQLRQELIQSYKISDEQLNQLATRRAEAVKAKIQSVDAKLTDRVSVGDNQTVSVDEAGVPIRVDIKTSGG